MEASFRLFNLIRYFMDSDKLPDSHVSCENCAYARQRNTEEN